MTEALAWDWEKKVVNYCAGALNSGCGAVGEMDENINREVTKGTAPGLCTGLSLISCN